MKTVSLGNTGIKVAQLGFGAMYLPRISKEESDETVRKALELGINYFDTAAAYQDSEEKLGRMLSQRSGPSGLSCSMVTSVIEMPYFMTETKR